MTSNWDKKFMGLAEHFSTWSKDQSRKVGAVIVGPSHEVLPTGYNGFPRGLNDNLQSRHDRPAKYLYTEHAERNAIYNCARNGVSTHGCSMYVNWAPCADCARAIIQSGIMEVISPEPDWNHPRWGENFRVAREMLHECGVRARSYRG
jgi:dCMP deaminase